MNQGNAILIVGPAWVGDMVMAQSLFIRLRQQDPNCRIDVLAPSWSLPLLARMPEVHRAIELPLGHGKLGLMSRRRLGRSLRKEAYDRAIVLPRSFKAALIPWFAKAKQRSGFLGEMRFGLLNDIRPLDKSILTQTVQRFVALGESANAAQPPTMPVPQLQVDPQNQRRLVARFSLTGEGPLLALLPGAEYGPAKQWPATHYAQLAENLSDRGWRVLIIGSKKDHETAESISRQSRAEILNLCGQTELVDAIDLIAACDAVVTNDSGLMHIAAAVNTPLLALYGSSTPAYTPPLSEQAATCYLALSCSPCFKRQCPLGHTRCLTELKVSDVMARFDELLGKREV